MLDAVQPCDSPLSESLPKIDRLAHRRLDGLLIGTDLRLQQWGRYGTSRYTARGYPLRLASASPEVPPPGIDSVPWPDDVVAADAAVRRAFWRHRAALLATYCTVDLSQPERVTVYRQLIAYYLANDAKTPATQRAAPGHECFKRDLDRGRWTVRPYLDPYGPDVAPPPAPEPRPFGYYSPIAIRTRRDLGQR